MILWCLRVCLVLFAKLMAGSNQDFSSTVMQSICDGRPIMYLEVVPDDMREDVFPKNLRQTFSDLFRKVFESRRVPDVIKSKIQQYLKEYLPEYPELHFFWTGSSFEGFNISTVLKNHLSMEDLDDLIEFFEDDVNVGGFKNDVGDWVYDYCDKFFANHFSKRRADLLFHVGDMAIQDDVQIQSLKDYYCALSASIVNAPESMSRFKKTKYHPFLTMYFRFRLLHQFLEEKILGSLCKLRV